MPKKVQGTPQWLRKQPYQKPERKLSVRQSEDFESVRKEFENKVKMSLAGKDVGGREGPPDLPGLPPSEENGETLQVKAQALEQKIAQVKKGRTGLIPAVTTFSSKTVVTRKMLNTLAPMVNKFTTLQDFEKSYALLHDDWLLYCESSEEQLEAEEHHLRPSVVEADMETVGDLLDKAKEVFKMIKDKYPREQVVIDQLDFVDSGHDMVDKGGGGSEDGSRASDSIAVGRGPEYAKEYLPKLKMKLEKEFTAVKEKFDTGKYTTVVQMKEAYKLLEEIKIKLSSESSKFEKLMMDLSLLPGSEDEIASNEEWQATNIALVQTLKEVVAEAMEGSKAKAKESEKAGPNASFNTYFKKQDLPRFKGDCIEYMEFKKNWASEVSSHNLTPNYEIQLLKKNIPEEGRIKLFNVENLASAWVLLDKVYGDKGVICQKLKYKLKHLVPKSSESHEIIIEVFNQVEYIVKRMADLKAETLLQFDNDYWNCCYMVLPAYAQQQWDRFDKVSFDNKWDAFIAFMKIECEHALEKRALTESLKDLSIKDKKDSRGGVSRAGGVRQVDALAVQAESGEEERKLLCKLCNTKHFFKDQAGKLRPSDRFFTCSKFRAMPSQQRAKALEKYGACVRCTSWGHKRPTCRQAVMVCKERVDGNQCGLDHSRMVCGSGVAYCMSVKTGTWESGGIDENAPTLSYLQDIPVVAGGMDASARTVWDGGSNRVLVNTEFARETNLPEKTTSIVMNVVGGDKKRIEVKLYDLKIEDMYGQQYQLWGYGVDTIIEPEDPVDPGPVRHLFPHVPKATFRKLERRRIDLLIGLNFNNLFPTGGEGEDCVGNLKALRTRFGTTGWILGGTHPLLYQPETKFSAAAYQIRVAKMEIIPDLEVRKIEKEVKERFDEIKVGKLRMEKGEAVEFWDSDQLGVEPPRRCQKCRQCADRGDCSDNHIIHTLKEEAELRVIEENMQLVDGKVQVKYPFKKDPGSCFKDNRREVELIAGRIWKQLKRDGLLESYHGEMKKFIERGTFVQLTEEEMREYAGPVNYITHHGVLKDSASTPLRIVTNSAKKNGLYSLNDLLPKGPNSLNDMLAVMVRFRNYDFVFVFDLSKAYNTMETTIVERHLRRFVWRWDEEGPWLVFAIDKVHFGDRPAATQLEVSKRLVAKAGEHIDAVASEKLIKDGYVDDILTGGTKEDVERMVGKRQPDSSFDGTMAKILKLGNFVAKDYLVEGDMTQADENLLNNKLFGYGYDSKQGKLKLIISLNLSKKRKNVRTEPDLTVSDLGSLKSTTMTKRNLLGITNSFGDFLGVAEPFTLRFKLLMKKLFDVEVPMLWDQPIEGKLKEEWIELIAEAVVGEMLVFPRRSRPDRAVGSPRCVGFGDGAFPAYGGCVYLVWETLSNACDVKVCNDDKCGEHFSAHLILGKSRVTPLRGYTVPRSEMSGAVLTSRMMVRVIKALQSTSTPPSSAIMLLDSECTISTLENSSSSLKPFFNNRRAEVIENLEKASKLCEVEEVHWVSSDNNAADILTRGTAKLSDIGPDSEWFGGPNFLSCRRESWPVHRDFVRQSPPEDEVKSWRSVLRVATVKIQVGVLDIKLPRVFGVIQEILCYNNNLESRKRVIARVINGWKAEQSSLNVEISKELSPEALKAAEQLILVSAMVHTATAMEEGRLTSLMPMRKGKLIVTRGRLGERSLDPIFGVTELPILMPESRVAELFMWRAHNGYSGLFHRSVAQTLAKSRSWVWIVRGRDLAKRVCNKCMKCRMEASKLQKQQMAVIREETVTKCPPWTFVSLDYAGPVSIVGEVNARSRKKAWILVYICKSTKAVCLLVTAGYDTASFLVKHEEFRARMGDQKMITTDRGTQLVKSGIVLAEQDCSPRKWDWKEVVRRNSTTKWEFVPIGTAHRNGLAESTVKILKKSLRQALTPGVELQYSEMITLLAKISHSINSRPLGIGTVSADSQQEDILSPLTPNHLLIGRSDGEVPPLEYDDTDKHTARLAYVTEVYQAWWDAWIQQVLPSLMPIRKWRMRAKNLQVGDIVMLYYPGNLKDDYRLARVFQVHPDSKGLVRTVTIGYRKRSKKEKALVYQKKPLTMELVGVQRLSLLVSVDEKL